jgi:hypothetical protein
MKKSNKLLFGGFLALLLLITVVQISLYANYKNGHYSIYHAEDYTGSYPMRSFPGIKLIVLRDVQNARVRFADTAQVETAKRNGIQFLQSGDSLVISGSNPAAITRQQSIDFRLPSNVTLLVENSAISFEPGKKLPGNNPVIHLHESQALFLSDGRPFEFRYLKIVASAHSIATFQAKTNMDSLDVQLSNSAFEYKQGDLGQLSIITDSVSHISLPSRHLMKAKITAMASQ